MALELVDPELVESIMESIIESVNESVIEFRNPLFRVFLQGCNESIRPGK